MQCIIFFLFFFSVNALCKNDIDDCWLYLNDVITNMIENVIPKITSASNHIMLKCYSQDNKC